jgi:hypothetical protein
MLEKRHYINKQKESSSLFHFRMKLSYHKHTFRSTKIHARREVIVSIQEFKALKTSRIIEVMLLIRN